MTAIASLRDDRALGRSNLGAAQWQRGWGDLPRGALGSPIVPLRSCNDEETIAVGDRDGLAKALLGLKTGPCV